MLVALPQASAQGNATVGAAAKGPRQAWEAADPEKQAEWRRQRVVEPRPREPAVDAFGHRAGMAAVADVPDAEERLAVV